jgi:hypothetical protein
MGRHAVSRYGALQCIVAQQTRSHDLRSVVHFSSVVCIFNDRTTILDNRFGPFTVPSCCGWRVFYKGTIFCAPPPDGLHRPSRICSLVRRITSEAAVLRQGCRSRSISHAGLPVPRMALTAAHASVVVVPMAFQSCCGYPVTFRDEDEDRGRSAAVGDRPDFVWGSSFNDGTTQTAP